MNNGTPPKLRPDKLAWTGWILWITTVGGLLLIHHQTASMKADFRQHLQESSGWMERVEQALATRGAPPGTDDGHAADALTLATEAKKAGDLELSLVYLANAIRSKPGDAKLLGQYTSQVLESRNTTAIQGAEGLLQEALFTVPPRDVPAVTGMLERISKARYPTPAAATAPGEADDPAAVLKDMVSVPLGDIASDRTKIEERIVALSSILEQIADAEEGDADLQNQAERQLVAAQTCALAHQVLDLAAMRFDNLQTTIKLFKDSTSREHRTAVLAALQATEAAVNQVWSVPVAAIPADLRGKLAALPEKLRLEAERIQDAVESGDIEEARAIWKGRRNQEAEYFDWKIIGCQEAMEKCSKLLGGVKGPQAGKEATALFKEMSEHVRGLKDKQLAAYQEWATKIIETSRRKYDDNRVSTDQDALDAFYDCGLQAIDHSLLAPEVAQFLQAVFARLLAELDAEGQARLQRDMSFSTKVPKKKLEDF